MKKTLSLVLAVLMIMATMPMALAADPIALTEANVTVWPTVEGSIYFGQRIGDCLSLSGGQVQYDGSVVPGHFEFQDLNASPTSSGTQPTYVKFIPEDVNKYTEFEINRNSNIVYNANATTPLFVDEINDYPKATKVVAGKTLATSTISGGKMYNPYNEDEPKVAAGVWTWTQKRTVVNQTGYYDARFVVPGYTVLNYKVWVNIEGDDTQPVYPAVIAEVPTIPVFTYEPNGTTTYGDLFSGGKAVIRGSDTEIAGTFALEEVFETMKPLPSHKKVTATFTPNDSTVASFVTFDIPVTINKAPLAFKDADGNIIPNGEFIFEVEPNEKINNIESLLYPYIQMPANSVYGIETDDTYAVNGKEYMVYVIHSDSNYVGSEIYFTVKFKETVVEPKIVGIGYNKYRMDCGSYSLPGTFAVAVMKDGALVDTIVTKSGAEFKFEPTASGKYTFNVTYVPTEGDYFVVDAFSKEYDVALNWAATIGDISTMHRCGDTVEAKVANTGVIGWKATDTNGNPVTLTLVSGTMESETFTFIMPDYNVIITPEFEAADDNNGGGILDGIGDIDGIDGILDFLRGIIEKIKSVFEKIIEFFQSIGDMS